MAAKVGQIFEQIHQIAPFDSAESFDNVGLLAGHPDKSVERVLVSLDLTLGAIVEAQSKGCQLIVTHHPVLFHGRKNLREDDAEGALLCALVRANLSMIAAHTNFDAAEGGVSEVLGEALGVTGMESLRDGLLRIGDYDGTLLGLAETARKRINQSTRVYGKDKPLKRVAVCGGAGSDFWPFALAAGADAYVIGEARHHDLLACVQSGMPVIDAGHYETERLSVKALVKGLQMRLDALQYNVWVFESEFEPFQ